MDKAIRILILVEGARIDLRLMEHLLHIYGIDKNHEVFSYNTNIYTLYQNMFAGGDPSSIDLLQLLKEKERDPEKIELLNAHYSDIILVFDFEPQDPRFSSDKITEMIEFFTESSDMGKLYINYPMVEAFYHMKSIPDKDYNEYTASMDELIRRTYKHRVNQENRNHDYSKFAVTRQECNIVIRQNIDKSWLISKGDLVEESTLPSFTDILHGQLAKMQSENAVSVLCTCVFYIVDYNSKLINEE